MLSLNDYLNQYSFKKALKTRTIKIIVDNAKTHKAKAYSLLDFRKFIDTRCPTDTIHYIDQHRVDQVIVCYFKTGPNKGFSVMA